MRVSKVIFFLFLFFQGFNLYAQPGLKVHRVNIDVIFANEKGHTIHFVTSDSTIFSSECNSYTVQMFEGNYQYGASAREVKIRNTYSSAYDSLRTEQFIFSDSVFKFHLFRLNMTSLITQIKFTYRNEVMLVSLDFNRFNSTEEEYKNKKIKICFKKGIFEIRDPKSPKLIPIKEDVIFLNNKLELYKGFIDAP